MVEITYQMVLSTLQTVGILVGIVYYLTIMRNSQKNQELTLKAQQHASETREAQLFMQLHESKYDPEGMLSYFTLMNTTWEDFDDYYQRYSRMPDPEFTAKMESQMSYFEGLGVLLKNKMVDLDTVYDMMGSRIVSVWIKYETVIKGLRAIERGPGKNYSENFEYLANEMIEIRKLKGLHLYPQHRHPTSTLHQELK